MFPDPLVENLATAHICMKRMMLCLYPMREISIIVGNLVAIISIVTINQSKFVLYFQAKKALRQDQNKLNMKCLAILFVK